MKASGLRESSRQELLTRVDELYQELFNLRFQLATNQLDNTSRLRQVRREIARISTVMRQQEIAAWEAQHEEQADV